MLQLSNHKADEKEAARNRKRLMALVKLPENQRCADCPQRSAPCPGSLAAPSPLASTRQSRASEGGAGHARGRPPHPRRASPRSPSPSEPPTESPHMSKTLTRSRCVRVPLHSRSERVGEYQPGRVHLFPVLGDPSQPRHPHQQGVHDHPPMQKTLPPPPAPPRPLICNSPPPPPSENRRHVSLRQTDRPPPY